jgi:hypothetical protein
MLANSAAFALLAGLDTFNPSLFASDNRTYASLKTTKRSPIKNELSFASE